MKNIFKIFYFIPLIKKTFERKYYATGVGTYLVNIFFKYILRVNNGDFLFHFTSRSNSPHKIRIQGSEKASSVYLCFATSGGCYYQAINGIEIGEGTLWSYNCSFISANHSAENLSKHDFSEPIRIGKNVWLGANCVVLPGVSIGDNSIIGAGSIVTKDIPSNAVAVGNPCKVIKYLNENN
ncbi:putative acetyltransferase [Chryseobacterium sp. MOF25P]|uniref:DapH/DapD/GlmU-related protein n=1 Tax=unclassified Chryseobacterium TaxID=2593645 RepID=UPI000805F90A|nr:MULTISPECIES: DapH/DapD/GlmU-related protein [unclassified Chryseobacterium]OBW42116.1 putative acetyltransferase [Chryseobacterium sp. MOF25P]OBW45481.1 putative acetyltransferase [Chryseobacterium sp. BGARF1]